MTKKWMVGLGNPGAKYEKTRHNAGFMAVMHYAARKGKSSWSDKNDSLYQKWPAGENQIWALMPQTFMNDSGVSLQKWKAKEGLEPSKLLVIYDDMDLPFGKLRFRAGGSGGSHNGMASIIECLGTDKFPRLRIGIGKPENPEAWADYVLKKFIKEEQDGLPALLDKCADAMQDWCDQIPHERLMSKYNA